MAKRKTRSKRPRTPKKEDNPLVAFLLLAVIFLALYAVISGPKKQRLTEEKPQPSQKIAAAVKPAARPEAKKPPAETSKPKPAPKAQAVSVPKPESKPVQLAKVVSPVSSPALPAQKGKIAIVIDDWGYSLNNMAIADQIKQRFTAAILPNLKSSHKAAELLHARGVEVILHLPMEPRDKLNLEKDTIMVASSEPVIRGILENDLDNVGFARGVNNHMGSEATRDTKTMEIIFDELKKKNLFFVDSFVLSESVCKEEAAKAGIRFARRDIFLDNDPDPAYIRNQMAKLKKEAEAKGSAIGIGHDRKNTLEVLKELMPEYEKEGFKFVFVSELAQ